MAAYRTRLRSVLELAAIASELCIVFFCARIMNVIQSLTNIHTEAI
jgi:hypothetical protein